MKIGTRSLNRLALGMALLCALVSSAEARTVKQKKQAARTQFETAEKLRDSLFGSPEEDRDRSDYQKVIDAYRKVYYTAPTSAKADAAVLAVAELLDDQGRVLNDAKSFKDAIGQLAFLRREYPGSKHRVEALFTIAQIYRDDLKDNEQAKTTFEDFLKHYPHSTLAPKAKQELAEIGDAEIGGNPFKTKGRRAKRNQQAAGPEPKVAWANQDPIKPARRSGTKSSPETANGSEDASSSGKKLSAKAKLKQDPPADTEEVQPAPSASSGSDVAQSTPEQQDVSVAKAATQPLNRLPRLTSIRHWSTPDYTRVAIDLEQEVKYQAGRVPHPDRIFFDLYGTKLASDLVGKTFDVDAGFLHKIRVAQFKSNMARVVLDVDDVAEYSAFLLPNPYRLIIDIHGKLPANQTQIATKQDIKAKTSATPVDSTDTTPGASAVSTTKDDSTQQNDVTVTQVKPADSAGIGSRQPVTAAGALQRAAETKSGPSRDTRSTTPATTTEVAKVDPPRIVVDENSTMDAADADRSTRPTTGPTYEAVAPKQSSRNKKNKVVSEDTAKTPATTTHVASPTANGERSLIRALGLKIGKIVVDAGHGGHDTGTIGPNGLLEKDLVLDVALKLGKLLEDRLGAEVVYTRDDDTFIPLETRTAIANKEQADLFISIHANSSSDQSARGVETYYLNFTSSHDALEVAARENAVSEKSIHELQDLVKKIALKEKIEESREFAADVQKSLYNGLNARNPGLKNRGVKKAPFIVLIGANMPSILAEISFVSNPSDERKLKTNDYRQRIADSLYKGVAGYINGLSGIKVASKVERRDGVRGSAAVAAK
ncbi:MAG TPA: N-acetylmuramoyl-L-alanine amidase [Candidatus Angelobacter sp.]|nr:N-acetylmuramoyl-L-alanine amidase [Candidatus Angelobacter sp.]